MIWPTITISIYSIHIKHKNLFENKNKILATILNITGSRFSIRLIIFLFSQLDKCPRNIEKLIFL